MPAKADALRSSLATRLSAARNATDALFAMLTPDAMTARPIPERHRVLFYLGHIEAFDWNLLCKWTMGLDPFNEPFDRLFAFGIDPANGDLPTDKPSDWPSIAEIRSYNRHIRRTVDTILDRTGFDESEDLDNGLVFEVAIEHRLMHAETLAYMLHWLPVECKLPGHDGHRADVEPARELGSATVEIPAGHATLGQPENESFGWDNEFGELRKVVPAFAIDRHNVTNGEYLEFVRQGGYEDRSLWTADDWNWKEAEGMRHPRFWQRGADGSDVWELRNMFDVHPTPESWPVYVSHAEASAYANWKGRTLPTEAQFHRAAYGTPGGAERSYPWGAATPTSARGNFDSARWDPTPVGSFPNGDSAFGVADLFGNGWEWTSTVFGPLPGFERFRFYPGYSADFFDGKHYVMKGGSSRTAASMLRRSFRNWFQPHYPHIYSSFRLVSA